MQNPSLNNDVVSRFASLLKHLHQFSKTYPCLQPLVEEAKEIERLMQPELPGMVEQMGGAGGKSKGTIEACMKFAFDIGLPRSDGEWFFVKAEGCGWKNNGKHIVNWKATMRAWQIARVFPSQKLAMQRPGTNGFKVDTRTLQQKLIDETVNAASKL